jgi:hypothetical protein
MKTVFVYINTARQHDYVQLAWRRTMWLASQVRSAMT